MGVEAPKRRQSWLGEGTPVADQPSVLCRDSTVIGDLYSSDELHLYGTVIGHIRARKVTLWPQGFVDGDIRAEEAHVHGHVKGRIIARTVVIGEGARIEGQVFHHKVEVAKGASIEARFPWRPTGYFDDIDHCLQQAG